MSIILSSNSSKWIKCQSSSIEKELKKRLKNINEKLGYDLCAALIFNKSRNIALVKSVYVKAYKDIEGKLPKSIFIKKGSNNILNKLIETKDIIESYEEEYALIKGGKSEALIPIFTPEGINMVLIGCIYLISYESKNSSLDLLSTDNVLNDYISDVSKLLTLSSTKAEQLSNVMNMINVFTDILEQKDYFLPNHSYNVANWCKEIGMELGLASNELNKLYIAGLLHDLGKTMIDQDILNKPSKLTEEEYEIIKEHPIDSCIISRYLLSNIPGANDIPKIVKHHHERYDGKGYPDALKGKDVPFYSYIIGIADAVDAMLSNRAYKEAMPLCTVIKELYKNKGTQFHPYLVDIMADKLAIAQKQFEDFLTNTINLSSLIISFKEDILILEGSLIKVDDYYIFKPFDEILLETLDLSKVMDLELTIKDLTYLYHFQVKLEDFVDKKFYISHLQLISSPNTFNLLWNLKGIIYSFKGKKEIPIDIIRIGGDGLSFAVYENRAKDIPYRKTLKLKIFFDSLEIDITGNVVKTYNFGPYKYFDLYYTNLPDFKRDMIFRQLFRKQIEVRKTISEYKY